ncbi:MAG: TULIP family P47-like protein [Rhodobacteraceae bacterium]|nr:TULIP family P47-like protein [Paracoccaceae bacterium]
MTLDGWDTVSLSDVALVNEAMVRRQNEFITEFDFKEGRLHFSGRFGAWQIREGGGLQSLNVEIPIDHGKLIGIPRSKRPFDVAGLLLRVKLKLRLLPAPDGSEHAQLMFDLDADTSRGPDQPVLPVEVIDPSGKISRTRLQYLAIAAAACLSAHAQKVTYVFASVKTRGTSDAAELATPYHDWLHVITSEGRQYLAIFGALSKPAGRVDRIDPALIKTLGSAYLALSVRMFHERFLCPVLSGSFKPRAPFRVHGGRVENSRAIALPPQDIGIGTARPIIDRLQLALAPGALRGHVKAHAQLPLGITFDITVDMTMRFSFDAKSGELRFLPDPKPKVHHSASLPQPFDTIIGWLVRFFLSFFEAQITAAIAAIARKMQTFNSPKVHSASWTGIRDFKTGAASAEGCIWLCDTRPVDTGPAKARARQTELAG